MTTEITIKVTFEYNDECVPSNLNNCTSLDNTLHDWILNRASEQFRDKWGHDLSLNVKVKTLNISNNYMED